MMQIIIQLMIGWYLFLFGLLVVGGNVYMNNKRIFRQFHSARDVLCICRMEWFWVYVHFV